MIISIFMWIFSISLEKINGFLRNTYLGVYSIIAKDRLLLKN